MSTVQPVWQVLQTLPPPPGIYRVPLEIHLLIMGLFDTLQLIRWRLVCRLTRGLAEEVLRTSQAEIVGQYLSLPHQVLAEMSRVRAIVTADAALAFFLRDNRLLSQDLELCVPDEGFDRFMTFLRHTYVLYPRDPDRICPSDYQPERTTHLFLIAEKAHPRRRYLRVVRVGTRNAIVGLHTLQNTAMMCFFNNDIMSCAFPALTLRRCAIIREVYWLSNWITARFDRARHIRMVLAGFKLSTYPHRLVQPPLADVPPTATESDPRWCMADLGLCGCNSRYFGDMYSLTVVLHPTSPCMHYLVDDNRDDGGPRLFLWSFPHSGVDCIGPHDMKERDLEYVEMGMDGVFVSAVVFNFTPTFVGAHMLGCRRTWHYWVPVPQGFTLATYTRRMDTAWWEAGQGNVGPLYRGVTQ